MSPSRKKPDGCVYKPDITRLDISSHVSSPCSTVLSGHEIMYCHTGSAASVLCVVQEHLLASAIDCSHTSLLHALSPVDTYNTKLMLLL